MFFSSVATFSFMSSYELSARASSVVPWTRKPRLELVWSCFAPEVRGHDDDAVAEVDPATLGVGQVPVLEDLQQDVEDLGMRLLDLVEEHDRVALAADRLGQLAALVEADVAGRRADEPRTRCGAP